MSSRKRSSAPLFNVWIAIFGWKYQNLKYFPAIIWKEKKNKINSDYLRGCYFISTTVKHPVHSYLLKVHIVSEIIVQFINLTILFLDDMYDICNNIEMIFFEWS